MESAMELISHAAMGKIMVFQQNLHFTCTGRTVPSWMDNWGLQLSVEITKQHCGTAQIPTCISTWCRVAWVWNWELPFPGKETVISYHSMKWWWWCVCVCGEGGGVVVGRKQLQAASFCSWVYRLSNAGNDCLTRSGICYLTVLTALNS